jgi:hypothetical protein
MEATGMLVIRRNGRNRAATYHLADLKELVISNGGLLDSRRKVYVLPPEQVQRLTCETLRVSQAGQRKRVSQSDSLEGPGSDTGGAMEVHSCRSIERHPLINKTQDHKTKNINLVIQRRPTESTGESEPIALALCEIDHPVIERIYAAYPRQIGKVKALKAISKAIGHLGSGKDMPALNPQKAVSILHEKVARYARSPAGNAGHFTPHAATWFNQARYLDDESEWQHVAETNRAQARLNSNLAALRRANAFDAEDEEDSDSHTTLEAWDFTGGGNGRFRTRRVLEGS